MRKNLHYKVLASVLAIAGLYFYNAPAAWAADIQNVTASSPETWIGNGTIDGNKVDGIEDKVSDNAEVYGWYSHVHYQKLLVVTRKVNLITTTLKIIPLT